MRPKLAPRARLVRDPIDGRLVLLYPERGLVLDDAGAAIARLCDGKLTVEEIVALLALAHPETPAPTIGVDVRSFLDMLAARGLLEGEGKVEDAGVVPNARGDVRPYTLVAELTHRCPLACPYCSNPLSLVPRGEELDERSWTTILEQAAALGVMQVHFTGGEPLLRPELESFVRTARRVGLFTNLITSGVPLSRVRLERLAGEGLDHVQVSIQSMDAGRADAIAGIRVSHTKRDVVRWVKELGLPLTLNVVLHAANVDEVDALVAFAEEAGAERIELANVQLHAWAFENRGALLPSREAIDAAAARAAHHTARLRGRVDVAFVKPDWFRTTPKACMDGWARRFVQIAPDGLVLPCASARTLPGLAFEHAGGEGRRALADIWRDNPGLVAYRGDGWMKAPCRTCDQREVDFGGCRCQAFALTGDATEADPTCSRSQHHAKVRAATTQEDSRPRRYLARAQAG